MSETIQDRIAALQREINRLKAMSPVEIGLAELRDSRLIVPVAATWPAIGDTVRMTDRTALLYSLIGTVDRINAQGERRVMCGSGGGWYRADQLSPYVETVVAVKTYRPLPEFDTSDELETQPGGE